MNNQTTKGRAKPQQRKLPVNTDTLSIFHVEDGLPVVAYTMPLSKRLHFLHKDANAAVQIKCDTEDLLTKTDVMQMVSGHEVLNTIKWRCFDEKNEFKCDLYELSIKAE